MARIKNRSIALPAIVDIDALDALRERLLEAFADGPVRADASAVQRVSTNAVVLLLSAAETGRRLAVDFAVSGPSPALLQAAERLGLAGRLAAITKG